VQRRAAEAEMARRDRVALVRQQAAGSAVPRAIGGEVDERDILEFMERRATAETAAADADDAQKAEDGSSGEVDVAVAGGDAASAVEAAAAAASLDDGGVAKGGDGSSEGSFSGSEEESEGSWTGSGEEEEGDSDIEEFYLKGGEGQMDDVEKKRKVAAEQKLVMVMALPFMRYFLSHLHSGSNREGAADEEEFHNAALRRASQAQVRGHPSRAAASVQLKHPPLTVCAAFPSSLIESKTVLPSCPSSRCLPPPPSTTARSS
jgi:hypothetical protein